VTTSASWDFSLTAAQVISAAWEDMGVIEPGGTIASAHQTMALRRLNMLAKQWQGRSDMSPGMKVHTRQRITLFLAKGQQQYQIGPASTDARATTLYGRTTLSANEALGQTDLSITSNTDTTTFPGTTVTMTNGDFIGIELDDGTIQWTTISGTPGATATVSVALTAAAAAGNYVWWFTSRAQRFPEFEAAVLRDENNKDIPLSAYKDAVDYEAGVADKYADGTPTSVLVEPRRITTQVTLNSQPTDVTKTVVLTVLYPAEDYDATTDDIAFPQEALAALSMELAKRCASSVGVVWTPLLQSNYETAVGLYRGLNPEMTSAYFQPGGCE
jgi:hypothetical protein